MSNNNDSFAAIDNLISLYSKGMLSVSECHYRISDIIEQYTWFISDPEIKNKAWTVLYKRYYIRMNKAINSLERR